jgi:hypothetical protein
MVKVQNVRDGRIREVTPAVAEVLVKLGRSRILTDEPAPVPEIKPVASPDPEPAVIAPAEPVVVEAVATATGSRMDTEIPSFFEAAVSEPEPVVPEEPRKKRKYTRRDLRAED